MLPGQFQAQQMEMYAQRPPANQVLPLALPMSDNKGNGTNSNPAKPFEEPDWSAGEYCCMAMSGLCLVNPVCLFAQCQKIETYEQGAVLRLGKQLHEGTLGGGLHVLLPFVDELIKIDIREQVIDMPKQMVMTREGLNIQVDGVVYFKVFDANRALLGVQNVKTSLSTMALTKVRETIGVHTYEQIQQERQSLAEGLRRSLDAEAERWGIDVTKLLLTEVTLPPAMQAAKQAETEARLRAAAGITQARGMADVQVIQTENEAKMTVIKAEAKARTVLVEAEAVARAKLIEADGERKAAAGFKEAAEIMSQAPGTLQLRFLQTLKDVGTSSSNTIMVPYDAVNLMSTVSQMKAAGRS